MKRQYGDRINLLVVQTRGSAERGTELLEQAGIPLASAARTRALHGPFNVKSTPTTLLIDADGVVRRRVVGASGHGYFARELQALLQKQ